MSGSNDFVSFVYESIALYIFQGRASACTLLPMPPGARDNKLTKPKIGPGFKLTASDRSKSKTAKIIKKVILPTSPSSITFL